MKKFKKVLALLLAALFMFSFAACTGNTNTPETTVAESTEPVKTTAYTGETVKVAAIKGPTGMGMVNMMDNQKYEFTLTSDPTEVVSLIATGAVDIAACPLNLAANLYKKTNGNVRMLGINTLGVLYVVTNGTAVNSLKDLTGKTVYMTGEGSTPEYIVNHLFNKYGIKDDVKIEYLSEHSELATKLVSGEAEIGILPEPFVTVATSKNANVKVALSLTEIWDEVNPDTELAMGCIIARNDFIKENPEAVKAFIADNKASVEAVNTDTSAASQKMVDKGIVDAAIFAVNETLSDKKAETAKSQKAAEVISRCNIVFIDGEMMKTVADANFNVYFEADPTSVGGSKVSAELYYAE